MMKMSHIGLSQPAVVPGGRLRRVGYFTTGRSTMFR